MTNITKVNSFGKNSMRNSPTNKGDFKIAIEALLPITATIKSVSSCGKKAAIA